MVDELPAEEEIALDDLSEQAIEDNNIELQPLSMTRSVSYSYNTKFHKGHKERKGGLQDWLYNYRKWKQSIQAQSHNVRSENCSSVVSVVSFLTQQEPIDLRKLESALVRQAQRACLRTVGLQLYGEFLNCAQSSWLQKYLVGVSATSFGHNLFERTECVNIELKSLLLDLSTSALSKLMNMLIVEHKQARNLKVSEISQEISKIKQGYNIDEIKDNLSLYFKSVVTILGEITSLIGNSMILKAEPWFDNNQELVQSFIYAL